jgi:type I restriction enzyme R subunit
LAPADRPRKGDDPHYLKEIIDRLNNIFEHATPVRDQAAFANQIASIAKENEAVVAQIENNSREQALKGNLPGGSRKAWCAP